MIWKSLFERVGVVLAKEDRVAESRQLEGIEMVGSIYVSLIRDILWYTKIVVELN